MKINKSQLKRFLGEFTATAMLMCMGCLGCVVDMIHYPRNLLMISISFGLTVTICMHCFFLISGAHINTSVTIANFVLGYIEWDVALVYIVLQILGALFGYGLVALFTPATVFYSGAGVCTTVVSESITKLQALGIEIILTATFIYFWCAIWDPRNRNQSDTISVRFGLLVIGLVLMGGDYTGASFNFARTLAPAIIQNQYTDLPIYLGSQLISGIAIPLLWKYVYGLKSDDELPE